VFGYHDRNFKTKFSFFKCEIKRHYNLIRLHSVGKAQMNEDGTLMHSFCKPKTLRNVLLCHFVYYQSQMDRPVIEPGSPR
jgi:hypothetical protein